MGRLRTVWDDPAGAPEGPEGVHAATLVRGCAVLLPTSTSHLTASGAGRQQHGELYLPPERLQGCRQYGALQLDAATIAMLEALLAPTITPASASWLVRAIIEQIVGARALAVPPAPASVALRMVRRFAAALERDLPLPSIDTVASDLGVSMRQLQRAAHSEFGASPVTVRRRVLAAHARALIAAGQTAASVSVQLGFATSGHLHRLLREVDEGAD